MDAFQELVYAIEHGVATLVFNRPERLNAWTPTLEKELRQALSMANQDAAVQWGLLVFSAISDGTKS